MKRQWMEYGSEFDSRANNPFITNSASDFVRNDWMLYRSGRDAMKALAQILNRKNAKVLLPALCCESMILPFMANGYTVEFYKLKEDLSADEADVLSKLSENSILLYIRYFAIASFSDSFLSSLRESRGDIAIVEDRTHDILSIRNDDVFVPDAMLSSLRKWAALPDGGMLKTSMGQCAGTPDSRFGDIRVRAMEKKSEYLATWKSELKQEFLAELISASLLLDESGEPVAMANEYRHTLEHLDFEALLQRRVNNCLRLKERLSPLCNSGKLKFLTEHPEKSTLYFPVILEERKAVQTLMAKDGIYCPVIWPEPEEAQGVCDVSHYITEHMLAIPCDQRYSLDDMDFIADTLISILNDR